MLLNLFFSLSLLYGSVASSRQVNASASNASNFSSLVIEDPLVLELFKFSGFVKIEPPLESRFFFYFFQKRDAVKPEESPLILWLMGTPGLSTSVALFHENGPFYVGDDHLKLARREHGWDKEANILYVEEPLGTGLMSTQQTQDVHRNHEGQVVDDLYKFIQAFFRIKWYEKFRQCPLFVIGQTYAGKYAPQLAAHILQQNELNDVWNLNLQGVAVGNGFMNPRKQFSTLLYHAAEMGYIERNKTSAAIQLQLDCILLVKNCEIFRNGDTCSEAFKTCNKLLDSICNNAGEKNVLDFTRGTLAYNFSNVEEFLNLESTKQVYALLQGGSSGPYKTFSTFNKDTYKAMSKDYMKNSDEDVIEVLDNKINVLIYAGENDLMCNWLGIQKWLFELQWDGIETFNATNPVELIVDGVVVERKRASKPLTFITIPNAGHYASMNRPKVVLDMIKTWMESSINS